MLSLTQFRSHLVPLGRIRNCRCARCGFPNLRVTTGTWLSNGLPCSWALCGKCSDRAGEPIRMCPAGYARTLTVSEPGWADSDNPGNVDASLEIQSCRTDSCGWYHDEMIETLGLFLHRPLSGVAKVRAEDVRPFARPGQQKP